MSNHNILRLAGIASILAAIGMVGVTFSMDQETYMPNSPLFSVFSWGSIILGIVLSVGLYMFYRQEAATLALVAAAVSILGVLIYGAAALAWQPGNPMIFIGDMATYVVGVALFSWLALKTKKVSRFLAYVGFVSALSGIIEYALAFTMGEKAAAAMTFYFIYTLLTLVWLVWTGISLLRAKPQAVAAKAA